MGLGLGLANPSPNPSPYPNQVRRGVAAQLRASGAAVLAQHEAEWIEMCLPEWEAHAAL